MYRMIPTPIIQQVVDSVGLTTRRIVSIFKEGIVQKEDQITGALVSELAKKLSGIRIEGIEIKVRAFSLREEKETKADLGVLFNVRLPEYELSKAFIAQAKICRCKRSFPSYVFSHDNITKSLLNQCLQMMEITPSSFVIVYTQDYHCGIRVFPAADVYALGNKISCKRLTHLYGMKLKNLFKNFLKCFIGDFKITSYFWGVKGLEEFISEYRIKRGLLVQLLGKERKRYYHE